MRAAIPIYLAVLPLLAQTTGQDPVIRVTVDLVQVDAVVTDSQGRHVAGMKPEDFQILEDGKPQKITHFSYVPGTSIAGGRSLSIQSRSGLPEKRPKGFPLPPESSGRKRFGARSSS
jgi:hypothetical protein